MAEQTARERPSASHGARYEDDLYTWAQEQVALLRAGRLDEIDAGNIAEELGDVGSEQYDKLESALEVLLKHMLKWDHQPDRRTASWEITILAQRERVSRQLRKNPGLKSRFDEAVSDGYRLARLDAAKEMRRKPSLLPASCPYDRDAIMSRVFERGDD